MTPGQGLLFPATEYVRVLAVRQPWAFAIIHAGKDVENRGWVPPRPCRILIYAAHTVEREGLQQLAGYGIRVPAEGRRGGMIIGSVNVTGWIRDSPSRWAVPGQWHWLLSDPVAAPEPFPWESRMKLGLKPPPAGWESAFPG